MADAVISVVVERFAAIIEDQIRYEINLVRGVEKELLNLSDKLKTIRNVLDDAERRGVSEQSVKSWLKKLEATAYEMDDLLDEWNYTLLKHKMEASAEPEPKKMVCCSFIPSSCLSFKKVTIRRDIAKKIENLKATLDQILKEKDDFGFVVSLPATDHVSNHWKIQSTSSVELEKIVGVDIERNKNEIVSKLMLKASKHTQILSIVGMGGLGKTTLAQLVYNDTRLVKDVFDLRIWVCVSDPFDVAGVARGIVESVTKESMPTNVNQLGTVLEKLRDCISGKRFLLVLDDVWTERYDEWEPLKINLRDGAAGSKILVTTRKTMVAKMMDTSDDDIYHPQQLSDEECWSLMRLVSLSGRSEEECGELEKVGKKIASKCKGLPLAANVLGRVLQLKTSLEEWEDVDKNKIWELENAKVDLFPHLVLSYNELSPSLKRCFSYCAVYPKDYRFDAETLIGEWMALGYLGPVSGNHQVELKGREYLNNLAMRSLFQDIEKSEFGEQIKSCKMHDIVHDFALFLRQNNEVADARRMCCQVCDPLVVSQAREYRCLFWDKESPLEHCDCVTSVRVIRTTWSLRGSLPRGMKKLIHLKWLDLHSWTRMPKDELEIICRLYFLQTLILSYCGLKEIPQDIGNLVHLRRLSLNGNEGLKELPERIFSLVELHTLSLADCDVQEIHKKVGNLSQLRLLDLSGNRFLPKLPESICSLVELRTLNMESTYVGYLPEAIGELRNLHILPLEVFRVGGPYNKLGLLKKLFHCLTRSRILRLEFLFNSKSEMVELVEDARGAELKILFEKLKSLKIRFWSWMDEKEQSSSSSLWMELIEALVPHHNLKELEINGYGGSLLPALWKLPDLEILILDEIKHLKLVGREFLGIESNDVVAFPKLRQLEIVDWKNLEEWEDITEEEEESEAISVMPCLTNLTVSWCPILKKLPHRLLHKVSPSLRSLSIINSTLLEEMYFDKEGSAWRSISQHNPHLRLPGH
ncbi:disease resistance protein RGA2-like [Salvia hispanica]|uniref:disease resistance protein RGA2-like n=1 Tax=Salvia hispanica TaxID=49212 RepID=UPI0020097389|nr:disease resistance protein RGA2-like [Salvia hispanica]